MSASNAFISSTLYVFTIGMLCYRAVEFTIENTMITEIISRETFPGDASRQLKINRHDDYFTSPLI